MRGLLLTLQSGDWLTRERVRLWALAVLLASAGGIAFLWITSNGLDDFQAKPLGTDFSNIYAGGTYVLDGKPELAFDPALQHAREKEIFGAHTPFYGWCYPPFLLFVAAALALMPYLTALFVWQATTFPLYLLAIWAIFSSSLPNQHRGDSKPSLFDELVRSRMWLLLAVSFPAVFVNLAHGHNGFLTAALMGFALLWLDRRPIVAGILFGLLAYKPQFGLLIPLVLIATDRWKTFAAAAATVGMLALAATLAFGPQVWPAFFASTAFTREVVLEAGGTGWYKIQTVFSWVRMWGGPIPLAYTVQILVTLVCALAVTWLWRSRSSARLKAAGLIFASLLSTPYSLDYDLLVLAPAIAFWAADGLSRGFQSWEKTTLAALWMVPLIARTFAEATSIPLAAPLLLVAFALLLHRAACQSGAPLLWLSAGRTVR
ncbi:MAG TPA: glycosyltransferase family 87 protein [Xanthobacteraceae bacterium]|nr:glycosyltransferase family 87 protein [Xanthobacteraceae bacterium]